MRRAQEMKQMSSNKADTSADTAVNTSQSYQNTTCKCASDLLHLLLLLFVHLNCLLTSEALKLLVK